MQGLSLTRWGLLALTTLMLAILPVRAHGELKPGDKLDKSNCQEAKGMLPEHVMEKFCTVNTADIIEIKDEAFQYSKKFRSDTEATRASTM